MLVVDHGGPAREQTDAEADLDVDLFVGSATHPDETPCQLTGATSMVPGLPMEQGHRGSGERWVRHGAQACFGGSMQASGETLPRSLRDLPDLHARVASVHRHLHPRRAKGSVITDGASRLQWYSHRRGQPPVHRPVDTEVGRSVRDTTTDRWVDARTVGTDHVVFDLESVSYTEI